jgi:myosin heavy subunit
MKAGRKQEVRIINGAGHFVVTENGKIIKDLGLLKNVSVQNFGDQRLGNEPVKSPVENVEQEHPIDSKKKETTSATFDKVGDVSVSPPVVGVVGNDDSDNCEVLEIEVDMSKDVKEAKELKVALDEDVKKQQVEAKKAGDIRRDEIRGIVREVLVEISEKEKEVRDVENEVKEEVKKGVKKDNEKLDNKKDEISDLKGELEELRKEHKDLLRQLDESKEDGKKTKKEMKRGLIEMFGQWGN